MLSQEQVTAFAAQGYNRIPLARLRATRRNRQR